MLWWNIRELIAVEYDGGKLKEANVNVADEFYVVVSKLYFDVYSNKLSDIQEYFLH